MNENTDVVIAQLELKVHQQDLKIGMLEATIEGLKKLPAMNTARVDKLLPLYSLLATRQRCIEEAVYSPENAAAAHEYWRKALAAIGVDSDPLNLERNE